MKRRIWTQENDVHSPFFQHFHGCYGNKNWILHIRAYWSVWRLWWDFTSEHPGKLGGEIKIFMVAMTTRIEFCTPKPTGVWGGCGEVFTSKPPGCQFTYISLYLSIPKLSPSLALGYNFSPWTIHEAELTWVQVITSWVVWTKQHLSDNLEPTNQNRPFQRYGGFDSNIGHCLLVHCVFSKIWALVYFGAICQIWQLSVSRSGKWSETMNSNNSDNSKLYSDKVEELWVGNENLETR